MLDEKLDIKLPIPLEEDTDNLRKEDQINSSDMKQQYLCDQCDFVTTQRMSLTRHTKNVHTKNLKGNNKQGVIHSCDHCEYTTARKDHVIRHTLNVHKIVIPTVKKENNKKSEQYHCDHCNFVSARRDHVRRHALNVHNISLPPAKRIKKENNIPKKHPCDKCQRSFRLASNLKDHKKFAHEGRGV